MSSKTILIVGANSQLAHSLNNLFDENDFNIIRVSYNKGPLVDVVSNFSVFDQTYQLIQETNPDFIINCAALTNVDFCEKNKKKSYEVNVKISQNILKAMSVNSKLIHISTDYIFDGNKAPYDENSFPNPINYYGKTKLESENLIRASQKKYIIIRTGSLFSEFIDLNSNKLCWIFNKLKNNEKIFTATDMISTPTSTASLAKIIFDLLSFNQNLIINYSGQDSMSVYEFSLLVSKIFNFNKELIVPVLMGDLPFKAKRPKNTSLKTDLISNLLNCNIYETEYSLNIIKDIVI